MTAPSIRQLAQKCRAAAPKLAPLDTSVKNRVLRDMAMSLRKNRQLILQENRKDVRDAKNLSSAMTDRLVLNDKRIDEMAGGLADVARLPDPVGKVVSKWRRPNGLEVSRVRIPLGVIGVVYESRPNVTVDAAGLCFKSGNAVILRGGSESFHSNQVLGHLMGTVLKNHAIPPEVITVVPTTERKVLKQMLQLAQFIDVIIPRGGESLMKFMTANSKIPIIKHDKGVCNLYIDCEADYQMAVAIAVNAKAQRPGVCNALENLFIHEKAAPKVLPILAQKFAECRVELRGDERAARIIKGMKKATAKDWETEYLDLILSVGVVKDLDEAIKLIRRYGSHHTEAIVTSNKKKAEQFIRHLDSSCIMVNASTRFNDGGELGLGAEIGISTTKMHAFGPMGLEELTTTKFVVYGGGQVRSA